MAALLPASPLVSVVIPTFNRRDQVTAAVASALGQDLRELEVIVVDDGSSDGTADALRRAFADDGRLRVLEQANAGCSSARNQGFDVARAPYVALLDSDDRCLPGRLRLQLDALEADPGAGLCLCDCWELRGGGRRERMSRHHAYLWPTSLEAMFRGAWAVPSGWMMRTRLARDLRFDPAIRYQEDIDFLFRVHEAGQRVVVVEEALLEYVADASEAPGGASAPRMSRQAALMADWGLWVYRRHWARLDPAARERLEVPTRILRLLTRHCEQTGRYARARHHLLAWWKQRRARLTLLTRWMRNLKRDQVDLATSPLGDLDIAP